MAVFGPEKISELSRNGLQIQRYRHVYSLGWLGGNNCIYPISLISQVIFNIHNSEAVERLIMTFSTLQIFANSFYFG